MEYITSAEALASLCQRLKDAKTLYLDTEFLRERTYYPKLCLIQIGDGDIRALVDPLKEKLDLSPLMDVLYAPDIMKVMHSARQDMELLFYETGKVPAPLFDTQIAAAFCGYGDQVSYDKLVRSITGVQLNKSSQFTDWSHRPLSEAQLTYAEADIVHLPALYEQLSITLEEKQRSDWAEEETAFLLDPALYTVSDADTWRKIKLRQREPRAVEAMQRLAVWREATARTLNQPRTWVLKDEAIAEMALNHPSDYGSLKRVRMMNHKLSKANTQAVLDIIREVASLPEDSLPPKERHHHGPAIPPGSTELLKVLLKYCADQADIAPRLLANASDIDSIASGELEGVPAMKGWRHRIFGRHAEAMLRGELALTFREEGVQVIELGAESTQNV